MKNLMQQNLRLLIAGEIVGDGEAQQIVLGLAREAQSVETLGVFFARHHLVGEGADYDGLGKAHESSPTIKRIASARMRRSS